MDNIQLFRKRIIPNECIPLSDDIILSADDKMIVTKWDVLHPRKDFNHGYSCYYLKQNFKVSRFLREDNSLCKWYVDIVEYQFENPRKLVTVDLLADVILLPNGFSKVADLDELAIAYEQELITKEQISLCLKTVDHLLNLIYSGTFQTLAQPLLDIDHSTSLF